MEDGNTNHRENKEAGQYLSPKQNSKYILNVEDFYVFKIGNMWSFFRGQHFSFWMICLYLFFEYFRPQLIYPVIDILPWAQLFLIGALVGVFHDKSIHWVGNPINKWLIVFAILIYASSLNAYFPEISQKHYIDFYSWFIVYFLIINIVNTKQRYYLFFLIFIVCVAKIAIGTSLVFAMRGFSFAKWGLMGPPGYFQNSGELAILMLTLFPATYYLYIFMRNKVSLVEKYILLLFWMTPLLTIIGSSSRGAQVALIVQLFLIFRKRLFKLKTLVLIGLITYSIYSILPEEQIKRFESAGSDKTSEQRLLYLKHGWGMMKDHPALGVGYFNFAPYYARHHSEDMLYDTPQLPHNILIQVGTDTGFLGLFSFFMLLLLPFNLTRKLIAMKENEPLLYLIRMATLYGVVGFFVAGQFVTVTYYPFFWIALSFVTAGQSIYLNIFSNSGSRLNIESV